MVQAAPASSVESDSLKLGRSMTADDLRRGLREINSGFSFDAATNRPSEYRFVLQGGDNMCATRGGVFHNGRYIGPMDRNVIPELPVWSMTDGLEEIPMSDIERYENTRVVYVQILPQDKFYHRALLKAQQKDDNFILEDGKVYKYTALREGRVRDKLITLGWRNTLLMVAAARIPGVTLDALNEKFGVRL